MARPRTGSVMAASPLEPRRGGGVEAEKREGAKAEREIGQVQHGSSP